MSKEMYCNCQDCEFYGKKVEVEIVGKGDDAGPHCVHCGSFWVLSAEEKAVADKAAKLIARDYGEVIKKLEDE